MPIPRSANIKIILLITAVIIVVATLIYTRSMVEQLLVKEHDVANIYARSLQFIANSSTDQSDYSFIFEEVIRSIDFPMILTDSSNHPLEPFLTNERNIPLDTSLTQEEQKSYLESFVRHLDEKNAPIDVILASAHRDTVIQHLHYGESALITELRWLPYIEIAVAGMFIILGYIGFSYIKRSEQSNIWVGMSKETAHQLGTPLSSLLGWIEMLKLQAAHDPKQLSTVSEMENDLERLQTITERFSKIGSKPSLKEENITEAINTVIRYYQRRLPSRLGSGKNIDIRIAGNSHAAARINKELFGWVIENLIKNAIDAMESGTGEIVFHIDADDQTIIIDVSDTGKGIDLKSKQDIFRPGYSTKQRGWGLGLSLSQRIIESYHKGKIFVKESRVGKGTTFRIRLPR